MFGPKPGAGTFQNKLVPSTWRLVWLWPVGQFGSTLCQAMGDSVEDAQHMGGVAVLDVAHSFPGKGHILSP